MRISETYQSKENRDARARELRGQGYKVRKSSARNVQMHPMYIQDFQGPEKLDTGFGNGVYKTYFAAIYMVEVE